MNLTIFQKTSKVSLVLTLVIAFFLSNSNLSAQFITTWKTTTANESITIPTFPTETYNYTVDWGDGNTTTHTTDTPPTHSYAAIGEQTISITGLFPQIYFANGGDKDKIISIDQWGNNPWTSMNQAFFGCSNLAGQASDSPNLGGVTILNHMFNRATSFNQNINNWDVSNITSMNSMFNGASSFSSDLNNWDTGKVDDMTHLFNGATSFNGNISTWDVRLVVNMHYMFKDASNFDGAIGGWETDALKGMSGMFYNAVKFKKYIGEWDVSRVIDMVDVFRGAKAYNKPLTNWDTGEVRKMRGMFKNAIAFNKDLSNFNTAKVETMSDMFHGATIFHGDIDNWDVSKVENMDLMFTDAVAFNRDIGGWTTTSLQETEYMFEGATIFDKDLNNWDVSSVTTMFRMFKDAVAFSKDLNDWNVSSVQSMEKMFDGATNFDGNITTWTTTSLNNMESMFSGATKFNQNIGGWETKNVTNMGYMFDGAIEFDQNLENWNVEGLTATGISKGARNMFNDVTLLTANYEKLLISWAAQNVNADIKFSGGNSTYCSPASITAHNTLTNASGNNWDITDGGNTGCTPVCTVPTSERDALIALYNSTNGANWTDNTNWNTAAPVKDWFGLTIDCANNTITRIELSENGLTGSLPIEIGNFPNLITINIEDNSVSSPIPSQIGNLSNLQYLYFSRNQFNGNLPIQIGDLSAIRSLQLGYNDLDGAIPSDIGNNLVHLGLLELRHNRFTGQIPSSLSNCPLSNIYLENNQLEGPIPASFQTMTTLSTFLVQENNLSGAIPNLTNTALSSFRINNNAFQFGGFETEFDWYNAITFAFSYYDQAKVDTEITLAKATGETVDMEVNCSGDNNVYQWYKGTTALTNGGDVSGANLKKLTLSNLKASDAGIYHCKVTNTLVVKTDGTPALTILRHNIILNISAVAQTYVPDDNFEQALIDFGYDSGPLDDYVPTANINTVTVLNVSNKAIADLTGIEDFIALENLDCSKNNLTSIDISSCTKLKSLSCSTNQLTTINTSSNPELWRIYTSANPDLETLDVTNNTKLTDLQFTSCKVASIDISHCLELKDLFCGNNELTSLNVANNPKLERIGCYRNPIIGLDVTNNTKLRILRASSIATSAMDFSQNTKLETLIIDKNGFSTLNLSTNIALKQLNCQNNNISILDLQTNIALEILDCQNNNISILDLTKNTKLKSLSCGKNGMNTLTVAAGNRLETVYCNDNKYISLDFSQTTALSRFQFENNPLLENVTLKNGNNTQISDHAFHATNCPKLTCIFVDDKTFSTNNWSRIDATSTYVKTQVECDALSTPTNTTDFVTTWKTTTPNESITIPTFSTETYNYTVDWGDGSTDATNYTGDATHTYTTAEDHEVSISGPFPRIYFNNVGDKEKIISIDQWGDQVWSSMGRAFLGCSNLAGQTASDKPILTSVTNMRFMFYGCKVFNQDIGDWDVSTVEDMAHMFSNAFIFDQDIGGWTVNAVKNMTHMFGSAKLFKQDLNNWSTGEVKNMSAMFQAASEFNGNITTWNTAKVESMSEMFSLAKEFNQDIGNWDTAEVTNMSRMFNGALKFDKDISTKTSGAWNTSKVLFMRGMFDGAVIFKHNIGNWDTSRVKEMSYMFSNATAFNEDIGNWNTDEVTTMRGMFYLAVNFDQNISNKPATATTVEAWNTEKVTIMRSMFEGASVFNGDIGNWKTGSVTNMGRMFINAKKFTQNLPWDVSSVKEMDGMFAGATIFNGDIRQWNTTNVEEMNSMFLSAKAFDSDISFKLSSGAWNTGKVENMRLMFYNAPDFNQNIGNWDTQKVTNMYRMFDSAIKFDQNLENWNVTSLVTGSLGGAEDMFKGVKLSTINYDALLIGWSSQTLNPGVDFSGGLSQYCTAEAERAILDDKWGEIIDAGKDPSCGTTSLNPNDFVTTWKTTNPNESITIPTSSAEIYNYTVDWGDGTAITTHTTAVAPNHIYATAKDYQVIISGDFPRIYFNNVGDKGKIISIDQWGDQVWSSMANAFFGCSNLAGDTASDEPILTSVTNMRFMFCACKVFNQDIGDWNVSTVEDMSFMFKDASAFDQDIGGWTVNAVKNMRNMFDSAKEFNQDISYKPISGAWNTENVTDMKFMFRDATSFDKKIGNWDTGSVTDMYYMFRGATVFNQNLANWDISSLTDADDMLYNTNLSIANYDALLIGWQGQPNNNNVYLRSSSNYCQGENARNILTGTDNWTITDNGLDCSVGLTCPTISSSTTDLDVLPTITWNSITGATVYRVLVIKKSDGTEVVNKPLADVSTYTLTTSLEENTIYEVTVFASDGTTETTGCSAVDVKTKTTTVGLTCPTITSATTDLDVLPTITWNSITGATVYRVLVVKKSDGTEIVNEPLGNVSTYILTTSLEENTIYEVTVFASDGTTETTGCAAVEVKTKTTTVGLTCPTIIFPIEGTTASVSPTIKWNASVSSVTGYRITIATDANETNIVDQGTVSSAVLEYTPSSNLAEGIEYFVKVYAVNGADESTGCVATRFTTEVAIPDCIKLSSPANGASGVAINANLIWLPPAVTNATGYRISIGETPGGVEVKDKKEMNASNSYTPTTNWKPNQTYYVTVTAYNSAGEASACTETSFTTGDGTVTIPDCTTLKSPFHKETGVSVDADLTWDLNPKATGYRISIGETPGGVEVKDKKEMNASNSYTSTTNWKPNQTYYVTVTAYNSAGEASACTETSFTTETGVSTNIPDIPPFFTPNNDGSNDYWQVTDINNKIKQIRIFDRFGKLLKQFNTNSLGWDGNYMGNPMPNSDYWYVLTLNTGEQTKGHFSLIRR